MSAYPEALGLLLVDHATEGLEADRRLELQRLQQELGLSHDDGFELAAAALDLAYGDLSQEPVEPLPASLQQRLRDRATGFSAAQGPTREGRRRKDAEVLPFPSPAAAASRAGRSGWTGWAVALAASLLAMVGWAPRIAEQLAGPPREIAGGPSGQGPVVGTDVTGTDVTARRQQLLGQTPQVVQVAWTSTEDPAASGVSGDLVWSSQLQEGYMLFNGLPVNDPQEWQYQLWIFDRRQDERYPIDGGVFDVGSDGSVVVPIQAQLRVDEPYLFAITIEKPGGVVVSSRERLPLVATL
jgi:hypothetical protein